MLRPDIEAAADRIAGHVRLTPVVQAVGLPSDPMVKLETLQHTGTFKVRGAFNRILSQEVPAAGVVAASGGNHGLAVAFAAAALGHAAAVFVPASSPAVKIDGLRTLGADVTMVPGHFADALEAAQQAAAGTGALFVHAYDQPEVVAGQGTLGRELSSQAIDLDTIFVAVGGGGLIGGIASWYRNDARVIGVEPEGAPTLHAALAAGKPVDVDVHSFAADSLGARRAGDIAFAAAARYVADVVLVSDDAIRAAQRTLWERLRMVAEPGGATALAPLLSGTYVLAPDERVGVILCGANTDPASLT